MKCTHPINIDDAENGQFGTLSTQTPIMVQQITPIECLCSKFLRYHNIMRNFCQEGDNLMLWDPILAEYASDYAKKLAKNNCKLSHTFEGDSYKDLKAGEKLSLQRRKLWIKRSSRGNKLHLKYWMPRRDPGINGWGGEGYKEDATGGMTGHYTAMMWFNNHKVGCGTGINPDLDVLLQRAIIYRNFDNSQPMDPMKCTGPSILKIKAQDLFIRTRRKRKRRRRRSRTKSRNRKIRRRRNFKKSKVYRR